ncbi:hypothetical protein BYT27DRAFT_7216882 [Phlegmacium glaucopus]|nr:hypothetical protein BYT27DRAFT_7216882 [Phlegmacium glaucopus]
MNREYGEMWTADWWWDTQKLLPEGATIAPVILSSDKTNLSCFSGDKQAWLVYLSIGNIEKEVRRQPTARAMVLVAYLPVAELQCFSKGKWSAQGYQLFYECMRMILKPLVKAGQNRVNIDYADGFICIIYPILAAYITDYPEQCLVACCKESVCPTCAVNLKQHGSPVNSALRDPEKMLNLFKCQAKGENSAEFKSQNLCIMNPDENEDEEEGEELEDEYNSAASDHKDLEITYIIAKVPSIPHTTIPSIIQDFGVVNFLQHLDTFLNSRSITAAIHPKETSVIPVYKQFSLHLPTILEVSSKPTKDTVHTTKHKPGSITWDGIKVASPAHFSTVLVQETPATEKGNPLSGVRIAQVRLIFQLPVVHGSYHHPLAYIHWFKPLSSPQAITDLGMFQKGSQKGLVFGVGILKPLSESEEKSLYYKAVS